MDEVKIVTSCFFAKLPAEVARVSIARSAPRGQSGFRIYRNLAPGGWFNSVSPEEYRTRYFNEILGRLNPGQTVKELTALAEGSGTVALLCWETAFDKKYCHRGYVSEWLHDKLGLEVVEYETPEAGFGKGHPKIPAAFRTCVMAPVIDRSAEILPHVGKYFRSGKTPFQVVGVSPAWPDQAVVTDGKRETTITVETLLAKIAG